MLNYNFIKYYNQFNTISENFKPTNLNFVISHNNLKDILNDYIDNQDFPNLLLYGTPGIGKTCLINACLNELFNNDCGFKTQIFNVLKINASEKRGVDMIKSLIINFLKSNIEFTHSNLKIIVFDEADNLNIDTQNTLKSLIDEYENIRFILICNYENQIIQSLKSRCFNYKVYKPRTEDIKKRLNFIMMFENIYISDEGVDEIIKFSKNDIRQILNIVQCLKLKFDDKPIFKNDILDYLNIISKSELNKLIKQLKEIEIKKLIKQINIYKYPDLIGLIYKIYENIDLTIEQYKELANIEIMNYEGLSYINFYIYLSNIFKNH